MTGRIHFPSLVIVAGLALTVVSASASSAASSLSPSNEHTLVPGNYCISCHLANDPRLITVADWKGSIAREVNSPCPAATRIHEELYYTARLLLMIDRAEEKVGVLPEKQQSQLEKYTDPYRRQLDQPVSSLDAFTAEAQTARYRLNKIYAGLNKTAEIQKQRTVLIYAALTTLILLGSLIWGLYNTRSISAAAGANPRKLLSRAVFVLAVLAFFALPVFRIPTAEVVTASAEEQEAQTILDTANRAASAADRAQARAWMLARVGVVWNETDPTQARKVFEDAWVSLREARAIEAALWGQSLSVQESTIGVPVDMENANLVATGLNAARARAWSLPLIAIELNKFDPVRAAQLLQAEEDALASHVGIYRDLQLRGVALAWAEIELPQAVATAGVIHDASIRAWTLRELAFLPEDPSTFNLAIESAREIKDPIQRARVLHEIAVSSGDESLFAEALSALDGVTGAPLAYALSDLAAASGDVSLLQQIDPKYSDARTAGLLRLGDYSSSWDESAKIIDPYERARAQAAIASAWANADAAEQIEVPLYRDLALRNVIRKTGNVALTGSIQAAYYQVQAWTALGDDEKAAEIADRLGDLYPLVELVPALAEKDPQAALILVEKMSRESDKAVALRTIAAVMQDRSLFERAQGMALAARLQGDVLAPAQASLDLATLFWQANSDYAEAAIRQAYEAALRISTK